jgi:ribA/ribD-fused uncharacterized protein
MIDRFKDEYEFLSNFYPSTINYEGILYPTVEHAFQAAKTLDPTERQKIANLTTPAKAKAAGRKVKLREGWNEIRTTIMREIIENKFTDPTLMTLLQNTGENTLVEGNTWNDTFWGVCRGKGQNWLGKILMETREQFKCAA